MPRKNNLKNTESGQFESGYEAVENGRKGGVASGKARKEKKAAAAYMKQLLDMSAPPKTAAQLKTLGFSKPDQTNAAALAVQVMTKASKGDMRAATLVYDLAEKAESKAAEAQTTAKAENIITMGAALETVAPHFLPLLQNLWLDWKKPKQEIGEIVTAGGRGSTKSSFCGCAVVAALENDRNIHAAVFRRYGNTMRSSVFSQVQWAVGALGLSEKYKFTVSPMEATNTETGQKILFFGMDDPNKLKSIKLPFGYIGVVWFEELDQFDGTEQIRSVEQSCLRGGSFALTLKSFNPPAASRNWANRYVLQPKPGQIINHSDYRQVPPEWLGERFIADAEHLRDTSPIAYEHEYLGKVTGSGKEVFSNVRPEIIDADTIASFDKVRHGIDWGFYPDPWAYNAVYYDTARRVLYIFAELTRLRSTNEDTFKLIAGRVKESEPLTADSAEKKSCYDYTRWGVKCLPAIKGPGSREAGFKWLQSLAGIVIDPQRCPDTVREFLEYEYDADKNGDPLPGYPDHNDHHMDAVRYAMEAIWRKPGA